MTQRNRRRSQSQQADLFHAPTDRPQWTSLPTETRETVIELVARMLKKERNQEAEHAAQEVDYD